MSTKTRGRGGKKITPVTIDPNTTTESRPKTYAMSEDMLDLQHLQNDVILYLPIRIDDDDVKEMMSQITIAPPPIQHDPPETPVDVLEAQAPTRPLPFPYNYYNEAIQRQAAPIEESDDKAAISNRNDIRIQHDTQYIQDQVGETPLEASTLTGRVIVKRNVLEMMLEFKEGNQVDTWIPRISQVCMWCCHNFDNAPIPIPMRYEQNRFHVYGCFCSFGCAAHYLFETNRSDTRWEQYSLMNLLYKRMYGLTRLMKVRLAPPRESLQMFGGIFTIEEFRQQSNNPHYEYNIIYPPMIAITPRLEEIVINHQMPINATSTSKSQLNVPINQALVDKAKRSLQEKRAGAKTNSLQAFLNLQVRSTESTVMI